MKTKICLFIMIAVCTLKQTANTQGIQQNPISILGEWMACKTTHGQGANESTITTHVCPVWRFRFNGTGAVGLAAEQPFSWKIVGKTLYIENKKGTDFIRNGSYKIIEQQSKTFRTIIIADTTLDIRYFLLQ